MSIQGEKQSEGFYLNLHPSVPCGMTVRKVRLAAALTVVQATLRRTLGPTTLVTGKRLMPKPIVCCSF